MCMSGVPGVSGATATWEVRVDGQTRVLRYGNCAPDPREGETERGSVRQCDDRFGFRFANQFILTLSTPVSDRHQCMTSFDAAKIG